MTRDVTRLCALVTTSVQSDAIRAASADSARASADTVASALPAIHRTAKPGAPDWRDIFDSELIRAAPPLSECERRQGTDRAAYFFWGYAAYPKGRIAFLLPTTRVSSYSATATPFDSGACSAGLFDLRGTPMAAIDQATRCVILDDHTLDDAKDLIRFGAIFLAGHFHSPAEYAARTQQSVPDYPVFHEMSSASLDRRAWTVEVQVHEHVPIDPESGPLTVVIDAPDLLDDLPYRFQSSAVAPLRERDGSDDFTVSIAAEVQHILSGGRYANQNP